MHKIYILFIIISISLVSLKSFSRESNTWQVIVENKHFKTWKLKSNNLFVSKTEKKLDNFDLKLITKKYIKKLNKNKANFLPYFGVKNWKMLSYKWKNKTLLIVKGSYKDNDSKKVSFIELHKFHKKKVTRLLFVASHASKLDISKYKHFIRKELR